VDGRRGRWGGGEELEVAGAILFGGIVKNHQIHKQYKGLWIWW
jgi:hypothetical protein